MSKSNRFEKTWRRKEPGARLSKKQKRLLAKSDFERAAMELRSTQNVRVIFSKKLWAVHLVHSFHVSMKNPLSRDEVINKMMSAFPGLVLEQEG